jgi:threonine dehydrogenase-like Zn-dependent dehydrogenase
MLGIWLENKKVILKNDLPKPMPNHNEALIKVIMSGICNTDIELTKGYYPYTGILGHEFVGIVEQGPANIIGKRIVGEINAVCGVCDNCLSGLKNHCSNRTVLGIVNRNGAFSEYLTLPIENLLEVPTSVSNEAATFTEPLAAALEIQQQVNICPNHKVLVIGDGKLGNLITQTLLLTGCTVWLLGHHQEKCKPLQKLGAIIDPDIQNKSHYFDIVIECTGNPEGYQFAMCAIKPKGILILKSTYAGSLDINAATLVVNEITLIGSRCGPFQPALNLLERNLINTDVLIEKKYPLNKGIEAMEHAQQRGAKKVLIDHCM